MTETNYFTGKHNTYKGLIYNYDYESYTPHTLSEIADRIAADQKFDERCKKNALTRKCC